MTLFHDTPDCPGHWRARTNRGTVYWQCDCCRAFAYPSAEITKRMVPESRVGIQLRKLVAAVRRLVSGL